ncbi:MAG TPA: hydrogenase maturation protease [Spirochaetia bacterium]|nr:hydrogenase maturation protease [Spirochaetia bacterium]
MREEASRPVSVIGLGNTEKSDDGVGVRVVEGLREELESGAWAPEDRDVQIVSAATDSFLAASHAADGRWVILVDAAHMGLAPGEFRMFAHGDAALCPRAEGLSTHDADLAQILRLVDGLGMGRRVRIMGIEAQDMGDGRGLSRPLESRLPEMRARIKEEVGLLP